MVKAWSCQCPNMMAADSVPSYPGAEYL